MAGTAGERAMAYASRGRQRTNRSNESSYTHVCSAVYSADVGREQLPITASQIDCVTISFLRIRAPPIVTTRDRSSPAGANLVLTANTAAVSDRPSSPIY